MSTAVRVPLYPICCRNPHCDLTFPSVMDMRDHAEEKHERIPHDRATFRVCIEGKGGE